MEKLVTILGITVSISTIISFVVSLINMQVDTKNKAIEMCLELNKNTLEPFLHYKLHDVIKIKIQRINNDDRENKEKIEEYICAMDSFCVAINEVYKEKSFELVEKICGSYIRRNAEKIIAYKYAKNTVDDGPYSLISNMDLIFSIIDEGKKLNNMQKDDNPKGNDYIPEEKYAIVYKEIERYWYAEGILNDYYNSFDKSKKEKEQIIKLKEKISDWLEKFNEKYNVDEKFRKRKISSSISIEKLKKFYTQNIFSKNELQNFEKQLNKLTDLLVKVNVNGVKEIEEISNCKELIESCLKSVKEKIKIFDK